MRLLAIVLISLALAACRAADSSPADSPPRLSAVEALAGGDVEGYRKALAPREFSFPADHGSHPDFKTEWWYFTGHLDGQDGERFGYQLTFFRQALAPPPAPGETERTSAWATRQLYMAHFALTDASNGEFHAFERLSRGAAGLAGAGGDDKPFRVWLEDWSVASSLLPPSGGTTGEEGPAEGGRMEHLPVRLRARADDVSLDLVLGSEKPPVFHGDRGLSRKGAGPGNASYYYSLTRLATRGRVTTPGREVPVTGSSWLDREWSTSVLAEDQVGWDWFSIQLDDGRELMVFQLRLEGGGVDPASHGTLVAKDGSTRALALADYRIEVTDTWRSPRGAVYPAGWRLSINPEGGRRNLPAAELDLELEPLLADQELDVSFRYWEGAVAVRGTAAGEPLSGRGYVELVGYGE